MERNDSNHILEVLNRYQNIKTADGYYRLHNCNIVPNYAAGSLSIKDKLIVTILDYGCVKECNLEDFKKADIRLIVAGAREWELEATEDALKRFRGEKNIKYLFNFLDGNQFRSISKYMDQLDSSRVPYEPNLFKYKRSDHLEDFIKNLMNG
jgi:serine/threonine-protein kinase